MQNTYHPQTAKLIAMIAQNMPDLSKEMMQAWIENPKRLKAALTRTFADHFLGDLKIWKTVPLGDGTERDLVIVSGEQLGIRHQATRAEIYEQAYARGLTLCPQNLIDRLHVPSEYQCIAVGTEVPDVGMDDPSTLVLDTHDIVECFEYVKDDSAHVWDSTQHWVFVLPRP